MNIVRRYVVVSNRRDGRPPVAVHANAGRNGNEDNFTYKTLRGAEKRLGLENVEFPEAEATIMEVKVDVVADSECDVASRALAAFKRFVS